MVVDDGIATGSTARAACAVARALGARADRAGRPGLRPGERARRCASDADEMVCLETPRDFHAVGQFYVDFRPTEDGEVSDLLERAAQAATRRQPRSRRDEEVRVSARSVRLAGHLVVPEQAYGLVVFAHGSGSSRHSPRNRSVAKLLQEAGLATLLFDLLTPQEEVRPGRVFDIELLATRLAEVTAWVRTQPGCASLPIGWFGASTGAGAALRAAAEPDADVAAVVSRGGRPDLAGPRLARRAGAHVADRRRPRRRRPGTQRAGAGPAARREPARRRPRRDPSVRGTRHARGGRGTRPATGSSTTWPGCQQTR